MRHLLRCGLVTLSLLVTACGPDAPANEAVLEGQLDSLTGADAPGAADAGSHGIGKVAVCHLPPGNPANAHTLFVGAPAVRAHLRHGDHLGSCGGGDTDGGSGEPTDGGSGGGEACQPAKASCTVSSDCCEGLACVAGVCDVQID